MEIYFTTNRLNKYQKSIEDKGNKLQKNFKFNNVLEGLIWFRSKRDIRKLLDLIGRSFFKKFSHSIQNTTMYG